MRDGPLYSSFRVKIDPFCRALFEGNLIHFSVVSGEKLTLFLEPCLSSSSLHKAFFG